MIFVKYLEDLEHSVTEFYNHREKDEGGVPEEYCFITQLKSPFGSKSPSSLVPQAGRNQHFLFFTGIFTMQKSCLL